MKQPWSDLPNAQYIDWVLKSLDGNPELWYEPMYAAWDKAWDKAWDEARAAAWYAARDAVWNAAWRVSRDRASYAARRAAWNVLVALIDYDDCEQYLNMGYEKLKVYASLSDKPQAILLLPMLYVWEKSYQNALNYNCII